MDKSIGRKLVPSSNFLKFNSSNAHKSQDSNRDSTRTWLRKIKRNAKEGSSSSSSSLSLPLVGHLPWDNGSRSRSCTGTTCCPGNRKTVSLWSVFGSRRSNRRPVYCRSARTIKPCWNRTPPLKWNEQPLYRDNLVFWYFMDVELFVREVRKVWDSFWKMTANIYSIQGQRESLEIFPSRWNVKCTRQFYFN